MTRYDNDRYRLRYIKAWDDNRGTLTVIDDINDGGVLFNFMSRKAKNLDGLRVGTLLYWE